MSIMCCAAARFTAPFWPVEGSSTSPRCTATVCANDSTNAGKVIAEDSSLIASIVARKRRIEAREARQEDWLPAEDAAGISREPLGW